MKVVKTDESWIVARQAALSLERLDPKGLWAHGILLQRPREDSSPMVVQSALPRPLVCRRRTPSAATMQQAPVCRRRPSTLRTW